CSPAYPRRARRQEGICSRRQVVRRARWLVPAVLAGSRGILAKRISPHPPRPARLSQSARGIRRASAALLLPVALPLDARGEFSGSLRRRGTHDSRSRRPAEGKGLGLRAGSAARSPQALLEKDRAAAISRLLLLQPG